MSGSFAPAFGRRVDRAEPPPPPIKAGPVVEVAASRAPNIVSGISSEAISELRAICLARLEPTAVATMAPERLAGDVERLISEISTERRIQLNAREQRALAGELVHDIL